MTDDSMTDGEGWFYTQGGQRKGPFPADELHKLLAARTIDGETPIWRKGLPGWQPLRTTEVGTQLKDTPPPVAPSHLNNGFVWALAFAPIAYLFMDVAILHYQLTHIIQLLDGTPVYDPPYLAFLSPLTWLVPLLTNAALCLTDAAQLKRAGYSSGWMTFFALLLAPAYLFMRTTPAPDADLWICLDCIVHRLDHCAGHVTCRRARILRTTSPF